MVVTGSGLNPQSCLHFGLGTHKSAPKNVLKQQQQQLAHTHTITRSPRERERESTGKLEQRDHIIYVHVCESSGLRIKRIEGDSCRICLSI